MVQLAKIRRFRRSRFDSKHDGPELDVTVDHAGGNVKSHCAQACVALRDVLAMRGRSFKEEIVVNIVFLYRGREKEDLRGIHCIWQPKGCW